MKTPADDGFVSTHPGPGQAPAVVARTALPAEAPVLCARREAFRHGQAGVQRQVEWLTEAYLAGVVGLEEYRRRRRELEQRERALAAQSRQLEAQVDRQAGIARLGLSMEEFRRRVGQGLGQASWEQKRQLVEWLVARVVVTDSEVEIRYVIPTSPAGEATRFVICDQTIEAAVARWNQVIGDGLRSHADRRQATAVGVAVHALNRMLELGRPNYVRIS